MKLSARNQFRGIVQEIQEGAVNDMVRDVQKISGSRGLSFTESAPVKNGRRRKE